MARLEQLAKKSDEVLTDFGTGIQTTMQTLLTKRQHLQELTAHHKHQGLLFTECWTRGGIYNLQW